MVTTFSNDLFDVFFNKVESDIFNDMSLTKTPIKISDIEFLEVSRKAIKAMQSKVIWRKKKVTKRKHSDFVTKKK